MSGVDIRVCIDIDFMILSFSQSTQRVIPGLDNEIRSCNIAPIIMRPWDKPEAVINVKKESSLRSNNSGKINPSI